MPGGGGRGGTRGGSWGGGSRGGSSGGYGSRKVGFGNAYPTGQRRDGECVDRSGRVVAPDRCDVDPPDLSWIHTAMWILLVIALLLLLVVLVHWLAERYLSPLIKNRGTIKAISLREGDVLEAGLDTQKVFSSPYLNPRDMHDLTLYVITENRQGDLEVMTLPERVRVLSRER